MTSTGIAGESDVKLAFEKALALAKVYYNCTNKAYETAVKEGDAHSAKFFKCCLEEVVRCPVMLYLCFSLMLQHQSKLCKSLLSGCSLLPSQN